MFGNHKSKDCCEVVISHAATLAHSFLFSCTGKSIRWEENEAHRGRPDNSKGGGHGNIFFLNEEIRVTHKNALKKFCLLMICKAANTLLF